MQSNSLGLGDKIELALTRVGVTHERVERWLGRPCNCPERREKLNRLGRWASRILVGKLDNAVQHLENIIHEERT